MNPFQSRKSDTRFFMAESHVVSGLVSKRAEMAGLIEHHQKEITRLSSDLELGKFF